MGRERLQHGLELTVYHFSVEPFRKALHIDLDGIHRPAPLVERLLLDIASADHHAPDPLLVSRFRRIRHVLVEDHGLAVGVRDRRHWYFARAASCCGGMYMLRT